MISPSQFFLAILQISHSISLKFKINSRQVCCEYLTAFLLTNFSRHLNYFIVILYPVIYHKINFLHATRLNYFETLSISHPFFVLNIHVHSFFFIYKANSLLVNIALGDLVVSGCVLPVSIVSLLAMNKNDDYPPLWVCKFQSFLISMVTAVSVLTLSVSSFSHFSTIFLSRLSQTVAKLSS